MAGHNGRRTPVLDIRWARPEDAGAIARLFLVASNGLAAYIWRRMSMPGRSLEEIGTACCARTDTAFSYENCLVATRQGDIVGMAHAVAPSVRAPEHRDDDPVLRPYAELEDPGSLRISGLAVFPEHRRQGIGGELMECVHGLALAKALPRISLLCFENNQPARDFCRRHGFREAARRPVVPHPSLRYRDGDVLLLVRES